MLRVASVHSPLVGLVFSALIAGCATTPGAIPGGESAGPSPQLAQDTPVVEESVSSELVWAEYPSDAGKFLEAMLPVLAVSADPFFLWDPVCAEMPVWIALEKFGTTVPLSLTNEAVAATMGYLPFVRKTSLAEAALQETSALRRHCNDVVIAGARLQSIINSMPANASEERVRVTLNNAFDGRDVLVKQSSQIYNDERTYLHESLRLVACYLRLAFPDSSPNLFKNLQVEWENQVLQAYALKNFVRLESAPLHSIPARELTEYWVEREWGSESSFEAWLCGPQRSGAVENN